MHIRSIKTGYMDSNIHIVIEDEHAIIVDPGEYDLLAEAIKNLKVDLCILTHEHCDHISGCEALRRESGCKVISSEKCDAGLKDSRKNFSRYYNSFVEIQNKIPANRLKKIDVLTTYADLTFTKEKIIDWRGHSLCLRETPGHSPGSICIIVDGTVMFSGDTLFKDDETGTHFMGGDGKQFKEETIPWLRSLPDNIIVYAGHGECFTLGERLKRL